MCMQARHAYDVDATRLAVVDCSERIVSENTEDNARSDRITVTARGFVVEIHTFKLIRGVVAVWFLVP